jgi:hypothetical protein
MRKKYLTSLILSVMLVFVTLPRISANVGADGESNTENNITYENESETEEDIEIQKTPITVALQGKTIKWEDVKTEESIALENARIEAEKAEQEKVTSTTNMIASRGGDMNNFTQTRRVEFHLSYYTNQNSRMEGGQYDKQGKRLTSHDMPVVALPKDVPYGSIVIFDEAILGDTCYTNVDAGGRIIWLNSSKTKCKVDVFVPNASAKDLVTKYENKVIYGWIYYKQ